MGKTNRSNSKKTWSIMLTTLVVMLLLAVVSTIAFLLKEKLANLPTDTGSEIVDEGAQTEEMVEKLFFTILRPEESDVEEPVLATYTKATDDLNSTLVHQELSELSKNGVDPEVTQISFSSDGQWMTFVAKNRIVLEGEMIPVDDAYAFQVYRAKVVKNSLAKTVAGAEQITDFVAAHKSNPVINNRGEVLFNSRGINSNAFNTKMTGVPSDWTIHYIDEQGSLIEFVSGLYPKWLGNDELVYVSDEGLMHSAVSDPEQTDNLMLTLPVSLADEMEGYDFSDLSLDMTSSPSAIFDISNDGKFLALSLSNFERAYSFRIAREESGVALKPMALINKSHAAWLQISPDNKYVGLLTYGPPSYLIYSLETFETIGEPLSVGHFDIAKIKITDWY